MSNEDYISTLVGHYRAVFPLSSVIVTGQNHTITGDYHHVHYEQPLNIFGGTRGTEVYVIGKNLNTVFSLLGDGGYANWKVSGWFKKDKNTVTFI